MSPKPSRFSRLLRWLRWAVFTAFVAGLLGCAIFWFAARNAVPEFKPITTLRPADVSARVNSIPHYGRDEDATYLTFVEWYLVFNPQEYAECIAHHRPSEFRYFHGIGQLWRSYATVYGMTRRYYPFNAGYNLMLVVIATSSTIEFGIKGAYEETIGRLSEWTASGEPTAADKLAAQVAHEYGEFIPTRPWFEFPFGRKFCAVWAATGWWGPHPVRTWERKLFLSVEYGIKTVYATAIRAASHAVYGVAENEVFLTARDVTAEALQRPNVRVVEQLGPTRCVLAVPHYQGFTDTVPGLAGAGMNFEEVAGNDEIMMTVIAPAKWSCNLPRCHALFEMPMLADADHKRVAVQVPIDALGAALRGVADQQIRVEHLFDY